MYNNMSKHRRHKLRDTTRTHCFVVAGSKLSSQWRAIENLWNMDGLGCVMTLCLCDQPIDTSLTDQSPEFPGSVIQELAQVAQH